MNRQSDTMQAITLFVYVMLSNAVIAGVVRHISGEFHTLQIVFFYNAFALLFFIPLLIRQKKSDLKPKNPKLLLTRAVLEFLSFSFSFYGMTLIPLPMHTSLLFVTPIFGTLVAIFLLGERPSATNMVCVACGFVGVLIITRPGITEFNYGIIFALMAAMGFALCGNTIKLLTRTETTQRIALYMLLMSTLISLPFGIANWHTPVGWEWGWMALIGLMGMTQQIAVAAALSKVPYTTVIPLNFTQLVFVSIVSFICFHELVDSWTVAGAAIIIGGTLYNAYHTTRRPLVQIAVPQTEKA